LLTASLILLTAFVAPSAAANERASGVVSSDRSVGQADVSEATRPFGASGAGFDLGDGGAVRAVANQSDPGPGLELIAAVYNSLMDRFFKPLDPKDLLSAAWEGARRAVAQQRRLQNGIAAPTFTGDRTGDLAVFSAQYRALIDAAGGSVDANRVAIAASDTMTQSVDEQHTYFLDPDQFSRYLSVLTSDSGRVGLGVVMQGATTPITISSVIPGSPAEGAGIQAGDTLQSIDGQDVSDASLQDVSGLLQGREGQPVSLTLGRGGQSVNITVVRARFKDAPLTMRVLPSGVCDFKLNNFPVSFVIGPTGRTIGQDFDYYLEQCEQAGGKGWIVDLRGNPGGNAISETLGRFMNEGPILVEHDRIGGRYEQATDGHLFRVQHGLVVLVDGDSASASEVFASAVQEHHRGVVMGQRSAGALNTSNVVKLPLGAGMAVAVREVFTGLKEVVVDQVGVTPDVTLNFGRDPLAVPQEAIDAALNPPSGVGPLPEGPNTFEGMYSADELKARATPFLPRPEDVSKPEDRVLSGEMALDTLHYYTSDYPSLDAARARAIRLGWQGVYARWIGGDFPPAIDATVSFYRDGDGAHQDLREIYLPDEPHNPPQWKDVDSPVSLGDETLAQVGTGQNDGRIWIAWRRGGTVYTVAQSFLPGEPQPFDEVARLATIVDQRAQAAGQ
jgi:C-terminal peptidase prc